MAVPPSVLRGRIRPVTYLYEDHEHPDRITGAIPTPDWTEDDRSLLLGLEEFESTICPGCEEPRNVAWHADAEGHFEAQHFVCHSCSARRGSEVVYSALTRRPPPEDVERFLPFDLVKTTTPPTPPEGGKG